MFISRRWNKEQKAAVGSPVFGYMAAAGNTIKTPAVGPPPYQLTLEDRLRWAQIADAMAQANHYAVSILHTYVSSLLPCKEIVLLCLGVRLRILRIKHP